MTKPALCWAVQECCYSWDWWWWSVWGQYLTDAPHAGSATAFNPAFWSLRADYQREDRRAHDVCCYDTTNPDYYCNKYYELRPVGECSTRIPFSFCECSVCVCVCVCVCICMCVCFYA